MPPRAGDADDPGMRASHVATAAAIVTAFTAGLTAASARHRRAGRPSPAAVDAPLAVPASDVDAVVLPFVRPVVAETPAPQPAAVQPAAPARCGESGGVTKAGAPCAARATAGGRCHRHPLAA